METTTKIGQEIIGNIDHVEVSYCGRIEFDPEEVRGFCDQWLYEQESIDLDYAEISALIDNMDAPRGIVIYQMLADAALTAWLESLDFEPTGADSIAVAPTLK